MPISNKKLFALFAFVFASFLFYFFLSFNFSHAQNANGQLEYAPLTPLPGTTCQGSNCPTGSTPGTATLQSYIPGMFMLIILAVAVLAVARIVYGGILYITTDAIQGKSDGKAMIVESVWGLVLISVSWLILYTISPRLVDVTFDIKPSAIADRFPLEGEAGVTAAPTGACPSCVAMVGLINLGISGTANKYIEPDTFERIKLLDKGIGSAGLKGTISEGYNPTGHQNPCHKNATCIDLNLPNESAANVEKIIDIAKNSASLRAIFEVETKDRKTEIVRSVCGISNVACIEKMDKNIMVLEPKNGKRQITGEHFSVYNCQKDPPSCVTFP